MLRLQLQLMSACVAQLRALRGYQTQQAYRADERAAEAAVSYLQAKGLGPAKRLSGRRFWYSTPEIRIEVELDGIAHSDNTAIIVKHRKAVQADDVQSFAVALTNVR